MTVKRTARSGIHTLTIAGLLFLPAIADAHVKWFCGAIDGSIPPAPPSEVLTPVYVSGLVLFITLVAAGGLVDAVVARLLPGAAVKSDKIAIIAEVILRVGMAIYAFCLWRNLAVVLWADGSSSAILTPDLLHQSRLVGWLQLSIAILLLIPRLSILAALGLATLYAMGAATYGLFYMIDYLFFLGIAAYVALSDPWVKQCPNLLAWRVPILTAGISLSLMWTAVEKFLFPQWTISVLVLHPGITAGYAFTTVATIAGFVEFSLAFYLLVGREILGRLSALLLMVVFGLAMPEFGILDVVGHISVIAILLVTFLHGETPLQKVFRGSGAGVISSTGRVAMVFVVMLAGLTLLFYGLHAVSVWAAS